MKNFLKAFLFFFWIWKRKKEPTQMTFEGRGRINSSSRRVRRFQITGEALSAMFVQGSVIGIEKGILPGGRFVGFCHDYLSNSIMVYIEHPFFDRAERGVELPEGGDIVFKDFRDHFKDEMDKERERER